MFQARRSSGAVVPALLVALVLAIPAAAAPAGSAPVDSPEVVADTFSVGQLAASARQVAPEGRLFVSGVSLEPGAPPEALELERVRVFTADARIVVHGEDGESEVPVPDVATFRGRVAGDLASLAILSVQEDGEVRGAVQRGGRTWLLGRERTQGTAVPRSADAPLVAREASALPGQEEPFSCGQEALPPQPDRLLGGVAGTGAAPVASTSAPLTTTPYTARVAVETDWEFYNKFGNVDDAVAYVIDLLLYASGIYDQEIDTNLLLTYLSLWTTSADPWQQGSVICGFYEFGRYWNANRTDVERSVAHFLSGKSNGGGVAWLGVLCNNPFNVNIGTSCPGLTAIDSYGGDYGYSGDLDGNFDLSNPGTVWDWIVVTHEIGHNFDSPHTHCYNGLGGSSDPVDECFSGDFTGGRACYSGTTSLPCGTAGAGCGTIMSYCHFQTGGLANIAPTFGAGHPHGVLPQRVPDQMRTHVEAVAGSNGACLARIQCRQLTLSVGGGSGGTPVGLPESTFGCAAGSYLAGERVDLEASPSAGWRVGGWSNTDDDASTWLRNALTMPDADSSVTVTYLEGCDDLLLDSGTDNVAITHEACGTLTAGTSYRVGSTGDVRLRSYQRVVLDNGFRVEQGGSLVVEVP